MPNQEIQPERIERPEKGVEVGVEKPAAPEITIEEVPAPPAPAAPPPAPPPAPAVKTVLRQEIEDVLTENLVEIYQQMPPEKQVEFKRVGEETAGKIEVLVRQIKVQVHKILELIKNWLRFIPGVSRFFLEQEAKIKTDKILALRGKER